MTINIKNVIIQYDGTTGSKAEANVVVDLINEALQKAGLDIQPQIIADIDNSDISEANEEF